jgi:hypothetical protein
VWLHVGNTLVTQAVSSPTATMGFAAERDSETQTPWNKERHLSY